MGSRICVSAHATASSTTDESADSSADSNSASAFIDTPDLLEHGVLPVGGEDEDPLRFSQDWDIRVVGDKDDLARSFDRLECSHDGLVDEGVIEVVFGLMPSYKDKKTGAGVAHTEWHRIVCFAKLAEYAKGLKKGDYVEVEGELRSSEFDAEVGTGKQKSTIKRRNWEVRASLVKKLAGPQHSDTDSESISEEDAA